MSKNNWGINSIFNNIKDTDILDFSNKKIKSNNIKYIINCIENNFVNLQNITSIRLDDCSLSNEILELLFKSLSFINSIELINIQDNPKLTSLYPLMFLNLNKLNKLFIGDCSLTNYVLPPELCIKFNNLNYLDIKYNSENDTIILTPDILNINRECKIVLCCTDVLIETLDINDSSKKILTHIDTNYRENYGSSHGYTSEEIMTFVNIVHSPLIKSAGKIY